MQREYGGELKKVQSPHLEHETETFRKSQDSLHRWICENIVISESDNSESNSTEYNIGTLGAMFTSWYYKHISQTKLEISDVIKEIESSALSKYLKVSMNGSLYLQGCRILEENQKIKEGEQLLLKKISNDNSSIDEMTSNVNWWI